MATKQGGSGADNIWRARIKERGKGPLADKKVTLLDCI